MRNELVHEICNDIEWAADNNDSGRIFRGLKDLGIWTREKLPNEEAFTAAKAKEHIEKIAGTENPEEGDCLADWPQGAIDEELGIPPDDT